MNTPSPEAQERITKFVEAYGKLTKKFNCDFVAYPVFVPDGHGAFKVVLQQSPVDTTNQPVKSPFIAKE